MRCPTDCGAPPGAAVALALRRHRKVLPRKREMLAQHKSQKEWLDVSQGFDAYLDEMERLGREVGRMSGRFSLAEGFTQHSHIGFSPPGWDPLSELLGADVCRTQK